MIYDPYESLSIYCCECSRRCIDLMYTRCKRIARSRRSGCMGWPFSNRIEFLWIGSSFRNGTQDLETSHEIAIHRPTRSCLGFFYTKKALGNTMYTGTWEPKLWNRGLNSFPSEACLERLKGRGAFIVCQFYGYTYGVYGIIMTVYKVDEMIVRVYGVRGSIRAITGRDTCL